MMTLNLWTAGEILGAFLFFVIGLLGLGRWFERELAVRKLEEKWLLELEKKRVEGRLALRNQNPEGRRGPEH